MLTQTSISWWIPGGSITYSGAPQTRWQWVRGTWVGYCAVWHMLLMGITLPTIINLIELVKFIGGKPYRIVGRDLGGKDESTHIIHIAG